MTIDEFIKKYGTHTLTLMIKRYIEKPSEEIATELGVMCADLEYALSDHQDKNKVCDHKPDICCWRCCPHTDPTNHKK